MDSLLLDALRNAPSLDLYELSLALNQMLADPRRILDVRRHLHLGAQVMYFDHRRGTTPLCPDDDRATAARLASEEALELARREVVVANLDRQPADDRVKRRPLRHSPRPQDLPELEAEVVVQSRRVVKLYDGTALES